MSPIIGIAGMPGSGKSTLLKLFREEIVRLDDFNNSWNANLGIAIGVIATGKPLLVTDVMFCDPVWRRKLEAALAHKVQWIVFENNPTKASANAIKRNRKHNLANELRLIGELTFKHEVEPMLIATE